MTFDYDSTADALEISFGAAIVARTIELDPGTLVDVDGRGDLVSVEIIRPARAWPIDELVGRFAISEEDVTVLRSMWAEDKPYPFGARELAIAG